MFGKKEPICRVCLSPVKKKCSSLFEEYKNSIIYKHINAVVSIEIKENDGLPDKICSNCLLELETVINFKTKCESSNTILHTSYLKPASSSLEIDVKLKEDVVVKKEEPEEEEIEFLDPDLNYFESDLYDIDDDKPLQSLKTEKVKKSRAVDLHLQCDDCKGFFKSKCKLRVHWKKVHLLEALKCKDCKRIFKSFKAFNRHQKHKSQSCAKAGKFRIEGEGKQRTFHCKECGYKSIRVKDLISHSVVHTGDRPFKCDLCPKTCTQLSSLQAHKESVHSQYKEKTCHYCGKMYKTRHQIYRHLKTHTSREVQCSLCNKILKNPNGLRTHMIRHAGVKSYTCEICATNFYTVAELCNHKRNIHLKKRTWYPCNLCDYKSHRSDIIKKHRSRHTDTNFPCTVCGAFYESPQKLILHQARHFGEKKYSCPQCDKKFYKRDSVRKHIRAKHKCSQLVNPRPISLKKDNRKVPLIMVQSDDMIEVELSAPE